MCTLQECVHGEGRFAAFGTHVRIKACPPPGQSSADAAAVLKVSLVAGQGRGKAAEVLGAYKRY